jgi:PKD repeat protein
MEHPSHRRITGRSAIALLVAVVALTVLLVVVAADGGDAAPNLNIGSADIAPAVPQPTRGTSTDVEVTVTNDGDANASSFYVKLRDVTAGGDVGKLGPYDLSAQGSMDVTFTWDLTGASGGKHTLRATADPDGDVTESDETDNTADRDVTVNLPPEASASSSLSGARTLIPIDFSAHASSDADGTIAQYLWHFGDGDVVTGMNVSHSYSDGGLSPGKQYNVTLVVTDEDGGVGKATISVCILNQRPVAVASGAVIYTKTPTSVSGSKSSDVDGKVTRFQWTLHNGTIRWGSPLVVSYDDDGIYTITLTVWDDDGDLDSTVISMVVLNQPPYVTMRANRTLVGKGDPIRFNASASEDVDGVITSITWIFGDATTATGAVVDHAFATNGSFNVTLVVVDDDGAVSFATVRIIVGNSPPIAVARADTGYVLTFENITFNASSSFDVDDNIVTYSWDFGDGRSRMGRVVTHTYDDDGTYTVTLTVTDTAGAYGTTTINVMVANRPPVAGFVDLEVMTREPAIFNGTYCYDPDGYIESFLWDLGGGQVYSTANASHMWERPGTYVITLMIWDDDGAQNETTFNVTVQNRAPIAVVTASPLRTTLAMPVTFNGSGSSDSDGTILNWSWGFGDGSRGYGPVVQHTYSAYGTYLSTLTVRDDSGGINTTGVTITVRNQPPTTLFNVTPQSALTGERISFNGSASTDPENQIAEYYWSFGDGSSATGAVVTHTYVDDGWYTVRLTVVDQDDAASYGEAVVVILNREPKATSSADPDTVQTLEDITFNGEGSRDDDGHVLWYRWDFGDGQVAYGERVDHAYTNDGTYTVTLTVTDDDGAEASATTVVTVENRAPFSVAGNDLSTRTGIPVRLDGRSSYDLDGQVVLYTWDFGDGTVASGPVVTHSFPDSGDYVVELKVTDDDGANAISNLTVSVANVAPVARVSGTFTVHSGEQVELDGKASYDLDGIIQEHIWDMGDGSPLKYGLVVYHTYVKVGVYTCTLTVEDDDQETTSTTFSVEVLNRRPTAVVSASVTKLPTGSTVEFNGMGSSDPDGTVTEFTWIFGDGSVAYGAQVNHIYSDDGIYMVVLTVTDNEGGTDSISMFVQVENRPPMPAIQVVEETLTLVRLDLVAEGSIDPDGEIIGYFWDFGDGAGENGWQVNHTYAGSGTYSIRLTVMDDDGRTSFTNVTIDVLNRAPSAAAEVAGTTRVNDTVKFDAAESHDTDGLIGAWLWDFGDETTGEGREAFHQYLEEGTYEWNLTVFDDKGDVSYASGTIHVNPRPVTPTPDGNDDDRTKDTPGPGPVLAALSLALTAAVMAMVRGRRDG